MEVAQVLGLFNIAVGVMLSSACVLMGAATVEWFVRLGAWPSYRDDAIHYMEWAVATLFVLVVVLSVVTFVQNHTEEAMFVLGALVVLLVGAAIFMVATAPEKTEEEKDR